MSDSPLVMQQDFQRGLGAHRAGNMAEAERCYKAILEVDGNHYDATRLLGFVLLQRNAFGDAETLLARAIAQNPNEAVSHMHRGSALTGLGRVEEAIASFDQAIALNPRYAEAFNNRGIALLHLRRFEDALESFSRAIALKPRFADAFCNRGSARQHLLQLADAITDYDNAIALNPNYGEAFYHRANALLRLGRTADAVASYDRAITIKPDYVQALYKRGHALGELGRARDAVADYDGIIALRPDFIEAFANRADMLFRLERLTESLADYNHAIAAKADGIDARLLCQRGNALLALQRPAEAIADYDRAVALQPDFAEAFNNRANALRGVGRMADALADYDHAIMLKPDFAEAVYNRASALLESNHVTDAIAGFDRAIALDPGRAEAFNNRANALLRLGRANDALANYDQAMLLKPGFAEAAYHRGRALLSLNRPAEAVASFDRAIGLKPDYAEAFFSRGNALIALSRYEEAIAAYDRAKALDPGQANLDSARLQARMHICQWENFERDCAELLSHASEGTVPEAPFALLPVASHPDQQRRCAELHIKTMFPASAEPLWHGAIYSHEKIRLAYLSSAFRDHPTATLTGTLFERHDRSHFETIAIAFSGTDSSPARRHLEQAFDRFLEVSNKDDQAIADIIRELEVDIAVDLDGFIHGSRTGILARRPAPIQVNYLGYPGTMGADYIDYIIGDRTVIPADDRDQFREKTVWLPDTYQPNTGRNAPGPPLSRTACGLVQEGFVFCCFNASYKITPDIFDVWMRLLATVDGSVLWMLETNPTARANLCSEAEKRGVAADRLVFAPRVSLTDHLQRQQCADLFLDTLYYNAHTTASDALWSGVPVLTCLGAAFAGRVAASLLKAIALPELITTDLEAYEALALKLAREPALLNSLKARLRHNIDSTPLFDAGRITRHLERAYETMWQCLRHGGAPQSFSVDPIA